MKASSFLYFAGFGIKTILFKKKKPILGTVIVTDKCNLKCKHCSVNNLTAIVHPYTQIHSEIQQLYDMGVRILFFCGDGTSYGYGLMILESPVGTVYMHSGATPRFFSYVIYSPQKELFLSIMSNYASETTFSVTKDVSTKILQIIN